MRVNQVIGVLAAAGVVALVGLSLNEDANPQTSAIVTPPTLAPVDVAPSTDTTPTTTDAAARGSDDETAPGTSTTATMAGSDTSPPPSVATTETAPTTEAAPTTSTTLVPEELRSFVELQVINGGAQPGRASELTAQLRDAGFAPRSPQDAVEYVDATTIYFAPGAELIALSVNTEIGVPPERLREVPPDEPNWVAYGSGLDVMVILGPS